MLADQSDYTGHSGVLKSGIHLPDEWLNSLIKFIANALPNWRDDPEREAASGETKLTSQLCSRLSSLSRHAPGWDMVQFKREEPDETDGRRAIDLTVAPRGDIIWIGARRYSEYQTLIPVECKRLPTPVATDRDEREYLFDKFGTAGGIQRFKAGHHGAAHARAAMIGYVQTNNVEWWRDQLEMWLNGIVQEPVDGWSTNDRLDLVEHDPLRRVAMLESEHERRLGLSVIKIDHLWIEI
ncbi:MAG: hypothetical protein DI587_38575 [Variovorax paradoxus]|uniref:hypothetical protein n=1 Tax=Agrobacterium pusense TaxID=648995 RepID=UPI000DB6D483|nr:MAG: hypothetical protein DI583_38575 [Variovorax paradoxus]PZP99392.1 MAG: hypothetical protein DI587_38575 [Variovorax paradoxus]